MSKKIRLGYDILSKRAIETESGVNIDEAIKGKIGWQTVAGTGADGHPDVDRPNTQVIYLVKSVSTGTSETYKQWKWTQPAEGAGYWECVADNTDFSDVENLLSNLTCIYVDPDNGDDANNGLFVATAVQTLSGAAEAYKNSRLPKQKFNVYLLSSTQLKLPTGADLDFMESPNIHIYGDEVSIANPDPENDLIDLDYPIDIVATSNVSFDLQNYDNCCSGDVTIKSGGNIVIGACYTSGNIKFTAAGDVTVTNQYFNGATTKSITIDADNISSAETAMQTSGALRIAAKGNVDVDCIIANSIDMSIGGTLTVTGLINTLDYVGLHSNTYARIYTGKFGTNSSINNFYTGTYAYLEGDVFTIGALYTVNGDLTIRCNKYWNNGGINNFNGKVDITAAETVNLFNAGAINVAGKMTINSSDTVELPPQLYVNELEINADGLCRTYSIYPKISDPSLVHRYVFNSGNRTSANSYNGDSTFETNYANIVNPYASVVINCKGHAYLCRGSAPMRCKSIDIYAVDLTLGGQIYAGSFKIDVANRLEQGNPGVYIYLPLDYGTSGDPDYISYDESSSNNTLKCGSLYCPSQYNSSSSGLIHPYYGTAIRNIDINIGMVLAVGWPGGGCMSPMVLGTCESGAGTFRSTISGHIGPYVGYGGAKNFRASPWNHDVRVIPPSYGGTIVDGVPSSTSNPGGVITLKYDDVIETEHFWFDPNQGDDTLDGCTRKTAVKSVTALVHAMMKKCAGGYDSTNNVFDLTNTMITIHVLSVTDGSYRDIYYMSSMTDVVNGLPNYLNTTGRGISFNQIEGHLNARVSFGLVEFVPETPNMSLYVRAFNASALIAKGFCNIGLCGYGCSGFTYLEASGSVGINNSQVFGNYSYYSNRIGPISIKARDIVLYGMFNNLKAVADNNIYIADTTGDSYTSVNNCCIYGLTTLEAQNVYLGCTYTNSSNYNTTSMIGLTGIAHIKASSCISCRVDSALGVTYMDCAGDIDGAYGYGYFKGRLHVRSNNCNLGSVTDYNTYGTSTYYSFCTYNAASDAGGAGIIDIQASGTIMTSGWNTTSGEGSLYGVDLYLRAPQISGNKVNIYGNNGASIAVIDAAYTLSTSISMYYYSVVRINAGYVVAPITMSSGGPWSPSTQSAMTLLIDIKYLQQPIRVYTSVASVNQKYAIVGHIDKATCKILNWGSDIDPEDPPSLSPAGLQYSFEIVVGHSTVAGHGMDRTGWIPDGMGSIIVLNDSKQLAPGSGITMSDTGDTVIISARNDMPMSTVTVPVVVDANDNTQCTASLVLNKYNIITGLTDDITDMDIVIPAPANNTLREVGFEFEPVEDTQLENVTFSDANETEFLPIAPDEYAYGCVYQGAVINRCVTLVEYGDPIEPEPQGLVIDGKTYRTVTMPDGKEWTAENLEADSFGGLWNVGNEQYGKYYNPLEVFDISVPGWHVATRADWEGLFQSVNGDTAKLKSSTGWLDNQNGTDDYGFTLLPCGYAWAYPEDISAAQFLGELYYAQANADARPNYGYTYVYASGEYMVGEDEPGSDYIYLGSVRLVKDSQ